MCEMNVDEDREDITILCEKCDHEDVCKFADDYKSLIRALYNMIEDDDMFRVWLDCNKRVPKGAFIR